MSNNSSLSQAIGRLISTRVPSTSLDPVLRAMLNDGTVGGVVFFKDNVSNLKQLLTLIAQIDKESLHPPILSVDQEGGAVQRFDQVISPIPSAMALAATNNDDLVSEIIGLAAKQLRLLGINCCLAPVLDVLSNPLNSVIATRAFSSDPATVSRFGKIALDAFVKEGVVPVAKHFPGHGSTHEDSHLDLAVNSADTTSLWHTDLNPFRACLEKSPAILIGHIWVSSIDASPLPASLSSSIIDGILRQYLGYDGLVLTDDMTMQAISRDRSLAEATLVSLNAGADHVLLCCDLEQTRAVHTFLLEAAQSGKLSMDRVAQANARIDKLFKRQSITLEETLDKRMAELDNSIEQSEQLVLDASIKAISPMRGKVPEINSGEWIVLTPNHPRYPLRLAHHLNKRVKTQKDERTHSGLKFVEIRYSLEPSTQEAETIGKQCAKRNCIFVTYRSMLNQGQFKLGDLLGVLARKLMKIHVAVDSPFDLGGLHGDLRIVGDMSTYGWETSLATFDPSELAMEAVASVLLGEHEANGRCPVDLKLPSNIVQKI